LLQPALMLAQADVLLQDRPRERTERNSPIMSPRGA